jgi:hypothetical protein
MSRQHELFGKPGAKGDAEVYDPLSYENLARSVVTGLMDREPRPLPPPAPFEGAGVYAIYYTGPLPAYAPIASPACERPIYVGKAVPPGGRKGLAAPQAAQGAPLFSRLQEHAKSLSEAENLDLGDFLCRYLVVVPVWVALAERLLLSHYKPVWNTLVDGFGNHDPGAGRRSMRRPRWDIIHPGRPWAARLDAAETPDQVLAAVAKLLREQAERNGA